MFLDFIKDIGDYETRKVERTNCKNGIIVSTANTSDEGYETALLDKNGTHPVERYKTKEEAIEGHKKWVAFAEDGVGKTIKKIGWSGFEGLLDEDIVVLEV